MKKRSPFLLGALLLVWGVNAQQPASSMFEPFKGDGFYWYKKQVDPEVVKPEEPPKPVAAPATPAKPVKKLPSAMSTEWLRENMPKLRDIAIDNPTKENVANYMYAQRVVLDKSQNFASAVKEVVATDPFLDENNRVPFSQYAQVFQLREISKAKVDILNHLSNLTGIWVFVDTPDKCSGCESYVNDVLVGGNGVPGIATQHKFHFKKIYVNTPEGKLAAENLKLKVTPTTVLVSPPNNFFLVSQGLMAQDQLVDRIVVAAKSQDLLPKSLLERVDPYSKGVMSGSDFDGFSPTASPSDVMKNMRERINGEKK